MILKENNLSAIDLTIKALKEGKIVIFPTDTIYGIACDASNDNAINNLYNFKERNRQKPLAIFVKNIDEIIENFILNEMEKEIINKYMPGAVTIILKPKKNNKFSKFLNLNDDNLAVRIPDHKFCLNLLEKFNFAIAVSSANISNKEYNEDIFLIKDKFQNKAEIIIEGKINKNKTASTILQIKNNKIKILRKGSLTTITI